MDLEPHRPASLPLATGPVLVVLGIAIHVGLAEWLSRHGASVLNHVWIAPTVNDLGTVLLLLGCVVVGLQMGRRA